MSLCNGSTWPSAVAGWPCGTAWRRGIGWPGRRRIPLRSPGGWWRCTAPTRPRCTCPSRPGWRTSPGRRRWGGLPLLKISGLDGLTTAQRQAAILTTLQAWFDPDRATRRPRFDADSAVTALVEAVTPRLTASVLVPSDPLDAEHKPVENLAVTSDAGHSFLRPTAWRPSDSRLATARPRAGRRKQIHVRLGLARPARGQQPRLRSRHLRGRRRRRRVALRPPPTARHPRRGSGIVRL